MTVESGQVARQRHRHEVVQPRELHLTSRLIVSQILLDAFQQLKMFYPKSTPKRHRELKSIRKLLEK
jgi:hypothetical protein